MDTYAIVVLSVNAFITILDLIGTFLLHFRFKSKCGKCACIAAGSSPCRHHSPIVPMEDIEMPEEQKES